MVLKFLLCDINLYITSYLTAQAQGFYIDAHRSSATRQWIWFSTGKPMSYVRWALGQPNSPRDGCIVYWRNHPPFWSWGDIGCSYLGGFICEKSNVKQT